MDLVDGTPILDIKPYVGLYDCVEGSRVPEWVEKAFHTKPLDVRIDSSVIDQLRVLVEERHVPLFYDRIEDVVEVLRQVVGQDLRSGNTSRRHARKGSEDKAASYCFSFDGLKVECEALDRRTNRIVRVSEDDRPRGRRRRKCGQEKTRSGRECT